MVISVNDRESIKNELNVIFADSDLDVGFLKTPGDTESGSIDEVLDIATDENEILAAFAYTLSRYTGRSDAVFCSLKNGIYYPHRIDCKNRSIKEYISSVKKEFSTIHKLNIKDNKQIPEEYSTLKEVVISSEKIPKLETTSIAFFYELSKQSVKVKIDYSEKLGKKFTGRFLKTFENILKGFTTNDTLGEINYSTEDDIKIFENLQGQKIKLKYNSVIEAFENAVKQNPNNNCVQHKDNKYNFKETDEITDGLANLLSASGVKKGDRVAFLVQRSEWYIFCFYGIMKAGAAVIPIDDKNPDERISSILSDSECKALIVSHETEERAKKINYKGKIINISDCKKKPFDDVEVSGDDLAAIYFTSGSTGKPKGVMIPHIAFENVAEASYFGQDAKNCVNGMIASIGFVMNLVLILSLPTSMMAVDVIPFECIKDMKKFDDYIKKNGISYVQFTPRLAKVYFETVKDTPLEAVGFGGDIMSDIKPVKGKQMIVGYGMTECSSVAGILMEKMNDISCVGYVSNNTQVFILDAEMRRVPYGGIGELYVAGGTVAKGYVGDAKANQNFIKNPYSNEKYYDNMYRTGDIFRFLPGGTLGIIGRKDAQVKIRGNRVELSEVESAIREMSEIKDVTVQAIENKSGKELCAYVVSDVQINSRDVQLFVSGIKPDYMVPSYVIQIDEIPINVNGKVNKRALPKPNLQLLREEYVEPRNEKERKLCETFSKVLEIEKIGIDDNFIQLGGDSLKAIRLASLFNSVSEKVRISTFDILYYQTPRKIAENCKSVVMENVTIDYSKGLPLNLAQTNMYTYVTESKNLETNVVNIIHFGDMSVNEIHDMLLKVIDAHPILKSRIVNKNGKLWNSLDTIPEINFYSEEPHTLCKRFIRHYNPGDVLSRFAITQWEGKTYLITDISHLIFDGRSVLPLLISISKALKGTPLTLDEGPLRQCMYEEAYYKSDEYKKQYEKTMSDLKNIDFRCCIPMISEDKGKDSYGFVPIDVDPKQLDATASSFNTTTGMFVALVFGYSLAKITKSENAFFHFSQDGRDVVNLENSVGMFVRTTAIILPYNGEKCDIFVTNNLPKLYEIMSGAPIPLSELRKKFNIWPNTLFQHQHFYRLLGDVKTENVVESIQVSPDFKSLFFLEETKNGYHVYYYHGKMHPQDVVEEIVKEYVKNLKEMVDLAMRKSQP